MERRPAKRWLRFLRCLTLRTYQANRLKCRYRDTDKKIKLCHTLNGSALALPRIVAALENNQTPDGIVVPECLRKIHRIRHNQLKIWSPQAGDAVPRRHVLNYLRNYKTIYVKGYISKEEKKIPINDPSGKWSDLHLLPEWEEKYYNVLHCAQAWQLGDAEGSETGVFRQARISGHYLKKEFDIRYNLCHPNIGWSMTWK